jgi:hypothetical protein
MRREQGGVTAWVAGSRLAGTGVIGGAAHSPDVNHGTAPRHFTRARGCSGGVRQDLARTVTSETSVRFLPAV